MKVPRALVDVAKSRWGWTATLISSGIEIAHSHDKKLLMAYLADCGLT